VARAHRGPRAEPYHHRRLPNHRAASPEARARRPVGLDHHHARFRHAVLEDRARQEAQHRRQDPRRRTRRAQASRPLEDHRAQPGARRERARDSPSGTHRSDRRGAPSSPRCGRGRLRHDPPRRRDDLDAPG